MQSETLIVIAGPTGTGKSAVAIALAKEIGGEVVNYDSVQLYRGFDIGSAKPSAAERAAVPHHLFDIVDAGRTFNAADWAAAAETVCREILSRGRTPVLAGGTGFYLRALLSGLPEMPAADPALRRRIRAVATKPGGQLRLHRWLAKVDPAGAAKIAAADRHRVERALEVWILSGRPISSWTAPGPAAGARWDACILGLRLDRERHGAILDARVDRMYAEGLVEETRRLLEKYPPSAQPFGSIGYKEAVGCLRGELSLEEAIRETRRRTRAYAKRQMTWLRAERNVHWIDAASGPEGIVAAMRPVLERCLAR